MDTTSAPAFAERFSSFVCVGDTISVEIDRLTITARIEADDCPDAPDERQDGFWPSLYKDAPGFIGPGPKHRERFEQAQAEAEAILQGWRNGDWFFCGIVLSVACEDVILDSHAASLWGIEANYPGLDNSYLSEVAGELLTEAITAGRAALSCLAKAHGQQSSAASRSP